MLAFGYAERVKHSTTVKCKMHGLCLAILHAPGRRTTCGCGGCDVLHLLYDLRSYTCTITIVQPYDYKSYKRGYSKRCGERRVVSFAAALYGGGVMPQ